jgi:VWFA-related protein
MNLYAVGLVGCLTAIAGATAIARQEQRPPRPQTFKAGVEVVSVDVNVVDREGRPLDSLGASDFTLTVDGKPRRITSAEFVRMTPQAAAAPAATTHYSTNANTGSGRLIALVVDQGNISTGRARTVTESALRFVKRLSPADRIGLFAIPGPGPRINFTANHGLIAALLPKIAGHAVSSITVPRIGMGEAARIARGDQTALGTAASRECAATEQQVCAQEIEADARAMVAEARERTRTSLAALRGLMEQLATNRTPKTVVFLSESLVIDQDRSELAWIGPLAARGRVSFQVLRIDLPGSDASAQRRSFSRGEDVAVAEEGLSSLAGLTRGSLFRVTGNADNIFNRVALEMSGHYLLGFEPEAADRDGKPHKIKIEVPNRRGIEVRARQEFDFEAPAVLTDEQALAEALKSPLPAGDIGLKVTAYTFRDAASQKLRILIAADIDRSQNPSNRLALGYALLDGNGKLLASQYEPQLKTPLRTETMTQHYVTAAAGDAPGVYGLKLAVVDDAGKRGSVEHAFRAQLTSAGSIRIGDLLIGEDASAGLDGATPSVAADFSDADALHGYLEIYGDSAEGLKDASVTLEVAAKEDARALESAQARLDNPGTAASRRVAEGTLPVALLPPGEYQARAIVSIGGRKVGQVTRPFRIARPAAAAGSPLPGRSGARAKPPGPFSFRVDPFQRASVLTPQVVGFFFERMGSAERSPVPAAAIEHARGGRFEAALEAATQSGHALAAAFLQGMTLYSRGDLEAAAVKFREALRIDSEFFPAAFYLGACYAAGGRDREASAAWQTSLVTESDAPFVYTLLADALLRQRQIDPAIEILNEATARWPDDPQVQMRLGSTLAMAGKAPEALAVLDAYLAKQPGDADRLFLALRLIYEAHVSGRTVGTAQQDRERFDRYAAAYTAAAGPQLALLEQWKKFMARR